MANDLTGKVAIVTGGASGIGEACVRQLYAEGASVLIADLREDAARALAESLGDRALGTAVDIADPVSCEAMVTLAVRHFGRLDIAVNNAGISRPPASIIELPVEEWRRILSINLDGQFYCLKAEMRAMTVSGGGAIVNIASVMGAVAVEGASAYVASKHGLVGLTKAAALEGAALGIRVNAVGPGFVETPLLQKATLEKIDEVAAMHALNRIAKPAEIATAVCFLASDGASFMTGTYYPVDGGYLAR